jgi:hypothetical protein
MTLIGAAMDLTRDINPAYERMTTEYNDINRTTIQTLLDHSEPRPAITRKRKKHSLESKQTKQKKNTTETQQIQTQLTEDDDTFPYTHIQDTFFTVETVPSFDDGPGASTEAQVTVDINSLPS